MKILRIFHGGVVSEYQRRDEELRSLGLDVELVVPRYYDELPIRSYARLADAKVPLHIVGGIGPRRNPWFMYNPVALYRILRRGKFSMIDMHEEPYSLAAAAVLTALLLLSPRGRRRPRLVFRSSQNVFKEYPPPFAQIQRKILKLADAAYVPSEEALAVLRRKSFGKRAIVVGNGVSIPSGQRPRHERSGRPLRVLYAGRLTERKGVLELTNVVAASKGVELTLIGNGELKAGLETIAAESTQITVLDSVSPRDLHDIMVAHDVIACPSRVLPGWSEQFSRALVEGMAHGCVPLVSTSGAIADVSGRCGVVFDAGSEISLYNALETLTLTSDPDLLRMAERSANHARRYGFEATSQQIADLYRHVLSGGRND